MWEVSLLASRLEGIAEEMGRLLAHSAFSPNIRDRLDFSCALFGPSGELLAQAAHIPVHLGSLPELVSRIAALPQRKGDTWMANDPYVGGTHLPDITLVQPLCQQGQLLGFAAARAHHSDVGGMTPGSMPNSSEVVQEGLRIPPVRLWKAGRLDRDLWQLLLANVRTPLEREGDLRAQRAACQLGTERLAEVALSPIWPLRQQLLEAGQRQMQSLLRAIPSGEVEETLELDWGEQRIPLTLRLSVQPDEIHFDYRGCPPALAAPLNCTRAITCAASYFPLFCLLHESGPLLLNQGSLQVIRVSTRPGTVVDATAPYPVCAGNVETSQRLCDLVWLALGRLLPQRLPGLSAATMNNLTLGNARLDPPFSYYETCGGGHGGGPRGPGVDGQQVAMTNTRNTPAEIMETYFPLRLWRYALRPQSGGIGMHSGGRGILREIEVLEDCQATLLASLRQWGPRGREGGGTGEPGRDRWIDNEGQEFPITPPWSGALAKGSRLIVETPGGGGWGLPS